MVHARAVNADQAEHGDGAQKQNHQRPEQPAGKPTAKSAGADAWCQAANREHDHEPQFDNAGHVLDQAYRVVCNTVASPTHTCGARGPPETSAGMPLPPKSGWAMLTSNHVLATPAARRSCWQRA